MGSGALRDSNRRRPSIARSGDEFSSFRARASDRSAPTRVIEIGSSRLARPSRASATSPTHAAAHGLDSVRSRSWPSRQGASRPQARPPGCGRGLRSPDGVSIR
jgi:hypothetical protein